MYKEQQYEPTSQVTDECQRVILSITAYNNIDNVKSYLLSAQLQIQNMAINSEFAFDVMTTVLIHPYNYYRVNRNIGDNIMIDEK